MKTPRGEFLFNQTWANELQISFNHNHNDSVNNNTLVLSWDPRSAMQVVQPEGDIGAQSPALGLLHEMYHWYTKKIVGSFDEFLATEWEKGAARDLGEPVRKVYDDLYLPNAFVTTYDTTARADNSRWESVQYGEMVPGPQYDPAVKVITGSDSGGGGGGEGTGGGTDLGGGSPPTPGDPPPKTGVVIVKPAAYDPGIDEPVSIDIIGVPELYY